MIHFLQNGRIRNKNNAAKMIFLVGDLMPGLDTGSIEEAFLFNGNYRGL